MPIRRLIREMPITEQPIVRVQNTGFDSLNNAELLSLIINRDDGLDLARDILARFGGLRELTQVTVDELQEFRGIGLTTAVRLKAGLVAGIRCVVLPQHNRPRITSPAEAANVFIPLISNKTREHLLVMVLDTRNRILSVETVYIGSLNSSVIRVAEVLRPALIRNGAAIIIAHNHPSGDPTPSPEDVHITRQIVKAGKLLDVDLLDHIIIGKPDSFSRQPYTSLKERGLGFD